MKWISDILKQFNRDQRVIVLLICLVFGSITCVTTAWIKSDSVNCSELVNLNKKYVHDLITISDLIRKQRMSEIPPAERSSGDLLLDSVSLPKTSPIQESESSDAILDSILKITDQTYPTK